MREDNDLGIKRIYCSKECSKMRSLFPTRNTIDMENAWCCGFFLF